MNSVQNIFLHVYVCILELFIEITHCSISLRIHVFGVAAHQKAGKSTF